MKREELEDLEKMIPKATRLERCIYSFGFSGGIMSLFMLGIVGNHNPLSYLLSVAAGTFVSWPPIYIGSKKLEEREKRKREKEEQFAKDQVIDKTTTNFLTKITPVLKQEKIALDDISINAINSLIYMININYYEQIKKHHPSLKREQLIENIVFQIGHYLKQKEQPTFTDQDIPKILTTCFFIPKEEQKKITYELKRAKIKLRDWIDYGIQPKKVEKEIESKEGQSSNFDMENIDHYKTIIYSLTIVDQTLPNYGDVNSLVWDFASLQEIITLIATKSRSRLIREKDAYSNFDMAASFIYNAMYYAIMNRKTIVTKKEMLATFKEWNYLSYELRGEIIADLLEKETENYEEITFPFSTKQKSKVISLADYRKRKTNK